MSVHGKITYYEGRFKRVQENLVACFEQGYYRTKEERGYDKTESAIAECGAGQYANASDHKRYR